MIDFSHLTGNAKTLPPSLFKGLREHAQKTVYCIGYSPTIRLVIAPATVDFSAVELALDGEDTYVGGDGSRIDTYMYSTIN
jgi:hypothetical protein